MRQQAEGTYWPGDEEIRSELATSNVYQKFRRGRLRMLLEATEDHLRGYTGSGKSKTGMRLPRQKLPIEHLLPQRWVTHWPVDDLAAEVDRAAHVHRLGNLTLVTASLNSSLSNGPWLGVDGKRKALADHDVLLMNRRIRDSSEDGWSEDKINSRTCELIDALFATWPVPPGHIGQVIRPVPNETSTVSLKDLVIAKSLPVGSRLRARPGPWGDRYATITSSGTLDLDGKTYESLSGAGQAVRGGATNGWWFWETEDGRRLRDLRAELEIAGTGSQTTGDKT